MEPWEQWEQDRAGSSGDIGERIDRLETYVHGLFSALAAIAHEMTGRRLEVLLTDADGSSPRRWVPAAHSAAFVSAEASSRPERL